MKLYFLFLLLPFVSHSQIVNSSFEEWYVDVLGQKRLVGWQHLQKSIDITQLAGTCQETNSQHLNYAITLSRWYDYTWDQISQKTAINYNPASLTGYYKYSDNDLIGDRDKDTAFIQVYLTKWNALQHRTDTIGKGYMELGPSATYRFFECAINYIIPGTADSLILNISPSKWEGVGTYCAVPSYCSFFTLDNLSLKGVGVAPVMNVLFPNPVRNTAYINLAAGERGMASIVNALGQVVARQSVSGGNNSFNVRFLSSGVYFLQIVNGNNKTSIYKFLKH